MLNIISKLNKPSKDTVIDWLLSLCIVQTIITVSILVAVYGFNSGLCISRYDSLFWNMGRIL